MFAMPLTPDLILATQKWNNNLAHICALMTACSAKHTMTASMLSSLSETADSRQSTRNAGPFTAGGLKLVYLHGTPESVDLFPSSKADMLYIHSITNLITVLSLLDPRWKLHLNNVFAQSGYSFYAKPHQKASFPLGLSYHSYHSYHSVSDSKCKS